MRAGTADDHDRKIFATVVFLKLFVQFRRFVFKTRRQGRRRNAPTFATEKRRLQEIKA